MRILIVTGQFGGNDFDPWLLDDLATALANAGDDVDVLVSDTKHARPAGYSAYADRRIRLFSAGPKRIRNGTVGRITTHLAAGWRLHTVGFGLLRRRRYDLVISTTIAMLSWGLPARLRRTGVAKRSLLILWDFFPIHHIEIGRIKGRLLEAPLRQLEGRFIKAADFIAVMSPASERFLRAYHRGVHADIVSIAPWASDPGAPDSFRRRPRFTVLFGGQLTAGRGVDTLLRAAHLLQNRKTAIELLVVGDGPASQELLALAGKLGLTNTEFVKRMPREAYRELLRSVHVGVAITVPGVRPPTFPSKIAEYCAAAVAVVVCVESASDAGRMVEESGAGLAVPAGDARLLAEALGELALEHAHGSLQARYQKARRFFEDTLSVTRAAETVRDIARSAYKAGALTKE